MNFEFKPAFERSIKALPQIERESIKSLAIVLIDVLSKEEGLPQGIGLKKLKGEFWEARHGIKVRILFRWSKDLVEFVLAGNHDDIKRFLRTHKH